MMHEILPRITSYSIHYTKLYENGNDVSNGELMWSLIGIMVGGVTSGLLFKRDMRRMDYTDLLIVGPEEGSG